MSYFCLVPTDATGQEHLTLAWCGKDADWNGDGLARLTTIEFCPIEGVVFDHDVYGEKPVALVALPHRIHLMRHELFAHLDQGHPGWSPHITQSGYRYREVGSHVRFEKAEWRP